jgi:hypothetical protein
MSQEQKPDFSRMTPTEIKKLYEETTKLARQQRLDAVRTEASSQMEGQLGFGDSEQHLDRGYIVDGPAPLKPKLREIVHNGYIRELKEGEEPPVSDDLVGFVNANLDDPRIKALLGPDLAQFEFNLDDTGWTVRGDMDAKGWHVTAFADGQADIRFVLKNDYDREQAIAAASRFVQSRLAPRFPELTEQQTNLLSRLAVSDRSHALILYIKSRLPEGLANEFEWRMNSADASGDILYALEFTSEPEVNDIVEEAVFAVWMWANPRATQDFENYVDEHRDRRAITFSLLDALWQKFSIEGATHLTEQEPIPTREDIENLSPEEAERLLYETRRLRAQQLRNI